jgi:integral membrane protein (TIGR00529 family)
MDFIFQIPYIIRVLITLGFMLVLYRAVKSLIFALLAGIIVLSFWSGHSLSHIINIIWGEFSSLDNIFLMLIVLQIIWLSTQMKETGVMQDLVSTVSERISKKYSLAVLPALIGLLPMPGGALFSAPMVRDVDGSNEVSDLSKTKINYWFRHVWEYWWPIYPGVLLAISLTKLEIWQFILLELPLSIFSIIGGVFFLLRPLRLKKQIQDPKAKIKNHNFFLLSLPIFTVIGVYTILSLSFPVLPKLNRYLPMIMAIFCAQVVLFIQRPLAFKKVMGIVSDIGSYKLALIVGLIRVYGAFIEARLSDGILLTDHMREELLLLQIPMLAVIMIIPFLSGLTTGIAVGYVGASFPIVISLLGTNPPLPALLSYTVVAFGFGYIGMMLSPLHVCHLVTNEYFKTNLVRSIIGLVKPSLVVLAGALLIYFLIPLIII